jgi:putative tryptophan/tyrosine transport system substrate-binding protein
MMIIRTVLAAALALSVVGALFAAHAQQRAVPVIGFLSSRSSDESAALVAAVRRGLGETGYVEGKNLTIEYRWAEGRYDRLAALASDLASRKVAVIVAGGGAVSANAAKGATSYIPIVFVSGADPVKYGLVTSLGRPGGNATGVTMFVGELSLKRLELLRELVPHVGVIGVLINHKSLEADTQSKNMQAAANSIRQKIHIVNAGSEDEFDPAFARLSQSRVGALLIDNDPFYDSKRDKLVALAASYKIPTIYVWRDSVVAGGLVSYGASLVDSYRQVGNYAGKILNGAKPGDLPVLQPTKFELVINLKTAKALGLTIPRSLLAQADEVIG